MRYTVDQRRWAAPGRWAALAALVCAMSLSSGLRADDSGELFPNVAPYDETVSSPISKPEKAISRKPPRSVTPATPVKPPAPAPVPDPVKNPPQVGPIDEPPDPALVPRPLDPPRVPRPRVRPPKIPGSSPPPVAPAPPPPPLLELTPLAEGVLSPILSEEDQKTFSDQYADSISKALAGTVDQRKTTAGALEAAAQSVPTPGLKRYLLLHSFGLYIRASTPLLERVQKAEVLLPLLIERSLPVVQARADALNDLMLTASSNPNERFLDFFVEAHATLAKLQVQAGFPKDAQESLKKAREGALHHTHKTPARIDQINEAAAWCERSNTAMALWPKFQAALKATPEDPFTNNMLATLHLSLYGNLEHAAPFAARSDRKDLKALADVLQANPPKNLSTDPPKHAQQVLAIASALVDVAKATNVAQPFDRYSIACYAGDRVEQLLADGVVPPEMTLQAQALLSAAKEIVDKTTLKRGDDLPKWLGGAGSSTIAAGTVLPPSKTIGTLADIFRGLPKELTPTDLGWTNKQMREVNDWLTKNVVGQNFEGSVLFDYMRSPVEGEGGKIYVPVIMGLPFAALTENVSIRSSIEVQMPVKLAARAKTLYREQQTIVKGIITSVRVNNFGDARRAHLDMVMTNKAD